jgi:hypothetical protein
MKKIEWLNSNKMKFESEFKTFNKATNLKDFMLLAGVD